MGGCTNAGGRGDKGCQAMTQMGVSPSKGNHNKKEDNKPVNKPVIGGPQGGKKNVVVKTVSMTTTQFPTKPK
jgi:hypothetical protein